MPNSPVCVDASIVVAMITPEAQTALAQALWASFLNREHPVAAPRLFRYEVTSALRRKVVRRELDLDVARDALDLALRLKITFLDPPGLSEQAFELAERFARPATYDAHYLALAEQLQCAFWTGDERLYNAVHQGFPHIRWLGNFRPEE